MHGRGASLLGGFLLIVSAGCADEAPTPAPPLPALSQAVNAGAGAATGTITGQVVWHGAPPEVPSFTVVADPENLPPDRQHVFTVPNPYAPRLAPTGGMEDVVVFLRGVDAEHARPWPHGPVQIEQRDRRLHVVQDGHTSRVGFVQRGGELAAVNYDAEYHSLRVRGAAFFTLPFVEPGRVTRRRLEQTGLVELMSGASFFWMHAKLLVVDQPYYTRTEADGRFRLEQVPAGRYELVCWLPSWVIVRKERDPESALISRLVFAPALEQTAAVVVGAGEASEVRFAWDSGRVR